MSAIGASYSNGNTTGNVFERNFELYKIRTLTKLMYVRIATLICLKDYKDLLEAIKLEGCEEGFDDLVEAYEVDELIEYVSLWDTYTLKLQKKNASNEEVQCVENALSNIPRIIQKHYDLLISAEPALQNLGHSADEIIFE